MTLPPGCAMLVGWSAGAQGAVAQAGAASHCCSALRQAASALSEACRRTESASRCCCDLTCTVLPSGGSLSRAGIPSSNAHGGGGMSRGRLRAPSRNYTR